MSLSVGILSWGSHLTLENTLASYKNHGLLNIADEIIIYFNNITNKDRLIAGKYNIKCIGSSINIGIGKAIAKLVEHSRCKYFLFLENDWVLIENEPIVRHRIQTAMQILDNNTADVVRLRHRLKYGDPLYTMVFKGKEMEHTEYLFDCVYWLDEPDKEFPKIITKYSINGEEWFLTSARYAVYTNNPCIYKKKFLETHVLPFTIDGMAIEDDILPWWRDQGFTICQGAGLFEHIRLDRANTNIFNALVKNPWAQKVAKYLGLHRSHLHRLGLLKPE
jgi:hypothetical protein